ncbi:Hypothetical predicted protein [Paramuricea clavata]|uniref:Uncharacterized protein n=1 Tax=Paramuricea clavata TaxID=317549 RepID=A0A7D9LD26_PARCT|nr:Hypothetical predicted protein [Paramuricea clavata]
MHDSRVFTVKERVLKRVKYSKHIIRHISFCIYKANHQLYIYLAISGPLRSSQTRHQCLHGCAQLVKSFLLSKRRN